MKIAIDLDIVAEAVYNQFRRNQAMSPECRYVDIIASKNYADKFHSEFLRRVELKYGIQFKVEWRETLLATLGMKCRSYDLYPLEIHCDLNVCIPRGKWRGMFAVPDYESETYFDILREKTFNFPTVLAPATTNHQRIGVKVSDYEIPRTDSDKAIAVANWRAKKMVQLGRVKIPPPSPGS